MQKLFSEKQAAALLKAVPYLNGVIPPDLQATLKRVAEENPDGKHMADGRDIVSSVFLLAYRSDNGERMDATAWDKAKDGETARLTDVLGDYEPF